MSKRGKPLAFAISLVLLLVAPAAAEASWGSIAIDPETGKIGYSRGEATAAQAKAKAKNECGTSHCKSAVWIFDGYAAVVQKKSGIYISGIGRTKNLAFSDARERAHEQSARSIAWVFSGYS